MLLKLKSVELSFVIFCIIILSFLLVSSIFRESWVYDEKLHINAGYMFLTKKDFRAEPFNPPLARELISLPLLFNYDYLKDPFLLWPRIVVVIFTILLALSVYIFSRKLYGLKSAYLALLLFIFEPEILAHGHYATTDIITTFFVFINIFLLWYWRDNFTWRKVIIFSIFLGLAFSTKISTLPFLLFSTAFLMVIKNKPEIYKKISFKKNKDYRHWRSTFPFFAKRNPPKQQHWSHAININVLSAKEDKIKKIVVLIVVVCFSLWATYFFTFEPILGNRFDPNRQAISLAKSNILIKFMLTVPVPLGSYLSSIKQIFLYNYSNNFSKTAFLFGQFSNNGFTYFFPVAFAVKTPLVLLLFFFTSFILYWKRRNNEYLLIPILVIFIFMLFSKVDLGIRYILPAYPFIIVFSSQIINPKFKFNHISNIFILLLLLFYIFSTLKYFPHYISYFNEFIESNKGYKYLIDSNSDWGQGLIDLKKYQEDNNINNLQLAYFGSVDPSLYKIKYKRIKDWSLGDSGKIYSLDKNSTIAISSTCWYYCGYYKHGIFGKYQPKKIIGGSILIF